MDVFRRLEVPIEKHYSAIITFFRHLFRKCNVSFAGEGAKPPSKYPTPIFDCVISGMKWNNLHESVLCISNEYR